MLPGDGYGYLAIPEVDRGVLSSFCCGKPHLDKFLKNTALALHESRLGFTSVVFHQQVDGPVGFFTLANDAIPLNESEKFELRLHDDITLNSFPAVKIGRLYGGRPVQVIPAIRAALYFPIHRIGCQVEAIWPNDHAIIYSRVP